MKTNKDCTQKALLYPDHPKPVTRRQFLAQGLLDVVGTAMIPSALDFLLRTPVAQAASCGGNGVSGMVPYLIFDCAGGAALSGNWVVGKAGGPTDFLASYSQMGVPTNPSAGEPIDTQFGVPMYTNLSQVRAGIVSAASAGALANVRMASLCVASQDDTGNNMLSPLILVSKAGSVGRFLNSGVGTQNSMSGGRSQGPVGDPSLKPLNVSSVTTMLGALSYGPVLDALPVPHKAAIAKAVLNLSSAQSARFSAQTLGGQFAQLAECGLIKNLDYVDSAVATAATDPRLNPEATAVYGLTPTQTNGTGPATIVYNVLLGNTGPGAISIGGCDYHDGTQTTGDAKDLQIGTEIGRAIELAHRLGKPLFFSVISDGSVYSDTGTRVWRGDAGSKGMAVIGMYDPAGPRAQRTLQLGFYKDAQGVERSTYIGNDPQKAAYTMFLNYLSACGRVGEFTGLIDDRSFDPSKIDAHLVFG